MTQPTGSLDVRPGDALLHPVVMMAVAILVVNDHVLKEQWPGTITGKLSDLAGLLFFPLFLQAMVETTQGLGSRWPGPSLRVLWGATALTASTFVAIQLWAPAADLYRGMWGVIQWPLRGFPPGSPTPVVHTSDLSDVLALPVLAVTLALGHQRLRHAGERGPTVSALRS